MAVVNEDFFFFPVRVIQGQILKEYQHGSISASASILSQSQLIISRKTVMKTWLPTDVLDHIRVCASVSWDKSHQSARLGGEKEGC